MSGEMEFFFDGDFLTPEQLAGEFKEYAADDIQFVLKELKNLPRSIRQVLVRRFLEMVKQEHAPSEEYFAARETEAAREVYRLRCFMTKQDRDPRKAEKRQRRR